MTSMKVSIPTYQVIERKVNWLFKKLNFNQFIANTGRPLSIPLNQIVCLGLYKQLKGMPTKKQVWNNFKNKFKCSYKTFVVNLNRWFFLSGLMLGFLMKINRQFAHLVKFIDSTDIPVCKFKNAHFHKTMKQLAQFGRTKKGTFYGLKLHIITDFENRLLSIRITAGNTGDRDVVIEMSENMMGIFIADAGYVSEPLAREFHIEGKRVLQAKPRVNMRKIMSQVENYLYSKRMGIELNFNVLKNFYGLITSVPRSVMGYLSNYIYSILAFQLDEH